MQNRGAGPIPTYVTEHAFDTFGRLLTLTLPSGERIRHEYDAGGNVARITGTYQGRAYTYLDSLHYDVHGRTSVAGRRDAPERL